MPKPVSVFFSYSHRNRTLRDQLEKHLSVLKRQGIIGTWHDRNIDAGRDIDREIDQHLETSDLILLLVSPDFLASEYCWGTELERAMQRHDAGESVVIPIILRPCDWKEAPFGKLKVLPTDGKPVVSRHWKNTDTAFVDVAEGIRETVKSLRNRLAHDKAGSVESPTDIPTPQPPTAIPVPSTMPATREHERAQSESQPGTPTAVYPNPVSSQEFSRRIEQAIVFAVLDGKPSFVLGARPITKTDIPSIFRSKQAEVVQLLEHPPKLRSHGADLDTDAPAPMFRGALRRAINPGCKLIELWRDGGLIFVAKGDESFLCVPPTPGRTNDRLTIHWIRLIEPTYLFADLSKKIYSHAEPRPEEVEYYVELHNLTRQQPSTLALPGDDRFVYAVGTAPGPGMRSSVTVNIKTTGPGEIAFKIVALVFEQYGVEHDRIPSQKTRGVIDPDSLIQGLR
jgi:hypothetical protein